MAIVQRGLDSGLQTDPLNTELKRTPVNSNGNQDYEDFSSRVIAPNKDRGAEADGRELAEADLVETYTMADDDNWDSIDWDPQVELLVIQADAAIDISTDMDSSVGGAGGITVAADTAFPIHVAGAPNGRLWIKRNAASGQPVVKAYGYGSRDMAFSTKNAFDQDSSQTA